MTKQKTKKTVTTKKTAATKSKSARKAPKSGPVVTAAEAPTEAAEVDAPTIHAALDERLPAPGTVIEKKDRHGAVRCKCTMLDGGKVRYSGQVYASISAAAMAAASDLGLENKTQNGYTFWGLSKPPRPAASHREAAERAWERCTAHIQSELEKELSAGDRTSLTSRLRGMGEQLERYIERVA